MMPLTGEVDDEDFVVRSIRCCVSTELTFGKLNSRSECLDCFNTVAKYTNVHTGIKSHGSLNLRPSTRPWKIIMPYHSYECRQRATKTKATRERKIFLLMARCSNHYSSTYTSNSLTSTSSTSTTSSISSNPAASSKTSSIHLVAASTMY